MRAGKIARVVGRTAAVAVLGLGMSTVAGSSAYVEDFVWDQTPSGNAVAGPEDFVWDRQGPSVPSRPAALDFVWD